MTGKNMARSIDDYFAFNRAALTVKNERLELISGNIANASTPGFKAKDLDKLPSAIILLGTPFIFISRPLLTVIFINDEN